METLTIPEVKYIWWQVINPKGKKIRCEVISGKGEVSLRRNRNWVGKTYTLSKESDDPDTVYINTNTATISVPPVSGESLDSIALRYGVSKEDITTKEKAEDPIGGKLLEIPVTEGMKTIEANSEDSLESIALRFGVNKEDIFTKKKAEDPIDGKWLDGILLEIPAADRMETIDIQAGPGDTLESIADRFEVRAEDISSNGEKAKEPIRGKQLQIPPTTWYLYIEASPGDQFTVDLVDEEELTDEGESTSQDESGNQDKS